jgi:anti-anti-sigma factor
MSFSIESSGRAQVVRVAENITFVNQKEFLGIWDRVVEEKVPAVVLDLSDITYFGSMAFGLVARTVTRLKEVGCRLAVIRPNKNEVFEVFRITRLVELIDFYSDETSALSAMGIDRSTVSTVVMEDRDPVRSKIKKLEDSDSEVRRYAAWALGLLGDPSAIPALQAALEDGELRVRQTAAESLEKLTGTYPDFQS